MSLFRRQQPVESFPRVSGQLLGGAKFSIPEDLTETATLLVVLFHDSLDPEADQWARLAERLSRTHAGRLGTYELPVYGSGRKIFGEYATATLQPNIENETERRRTVALFVDKRAFARELQCPDPSTVYAFLVDRTGRIAWRGEGEIGLPELAELERAVNSLLLAVAPETLADGAPSG